MINLKLSLLKDRLEGYLLKGAAVGIALSIANAGPARGKELILWERLKLEPQIAVTETYDDNIYLTDTQRKDDFITSLTAALDTQFAFTPHSRIDLFYSGVFDHYQDADNFRKDHHYGNASYQMESAKGSALEVGAWGEDSAKQPYAIDERSKDYYIGALYTDLSLNLGASTTVFGNFQRSIRRFDEEIDRRDDYDRDNFALGLVNSRSSLFPWLLEYRYETEKNDQPDLPRTDFTSHAGYAGFKWGRGHRLFGTLRGGYLWSDFNSEHAYDGWATDTDLSYALGSFTTATAIAERGVRKSTRSARETLDYFIYAGAGLSVAYTRLDPIFVRISGAYENRDYRSTNATSDQRKDDQYVAGITAQYQFSDWLSFSLGYRYRTNDSNIDTFSYVENRILAEIVLFATKDIRKRLRSRSSDEFNYF